MAPLPRALIQILPHVQFRLASSSSPSRRLAKPTKFNRPSHPSQRPKDPVNYPGPPRKEDPIKEYPHTMPPPDTWAHWFLTNRRLHFYMSLSILATLASVVTVTNFLFTNPHATDVYWCWANPIGSIHSLLLAWKHSAQAESERIKEMRRKKVEDVEKRGEYRKAHGLEHTGGEGGFGGWALKRGTGDPKVRASMVVEDAKRIDEVSPINGKESWVEEQLRTIEEEGRATPGRAVSQLQTHDREKKSWWKWF